MHVMTRYLPNPVDIYGYELHMYDKVFQSRPQNPEWRTFVINRKF